MSTDTASAPDSVAGYAAETLSDFLPVAPVWQPEVAAARRPRRARSLRR